MSSYSIRSNQQAFRALLSQNVDLVILKASPGQGRRILLIKQYLAEHKDITGSGEHELLCG